MMQNKRIAVTGGIGSGKSAACRIIRDMGIPVFSCDEIYAEVVRRKEVTDQIALAFPDCVVKGKIDRASLAKRVFSDECARKHLNAITHPIIMEELFKYMQPYAVSVAEVPLLFEEGLEIYFDEVIALRRDVSLRVLEVCKRDNVTEEDVLLRMRRQFDPSRLSEKNCTVIENDGTISQLEEKIKAYFSK